MPFVRKITEYLESLAPLSLQEDYDNSGLITGDKNMEITGVLITLDCTELVIDEAIKKGLNLVIAHHPILFKGLKRLNGSNYVERTIIKAIKNDIAIYAIHTNLDHVSNGVNAKFAEKLNLRNTRILKPINNLRKLVSFIPQSHTEQLLDELHGAGAGSLGEYKECSFRVTGTGRFTPGDSSNPMIGERNKSEEVTEDRIEIILPESRTDDVLKALKKVHPYEEAAYYLTSIDNLNENNGAGLIGELKEEKSVAEFLAHIKKLMKLDVIKHTSYDGTIKKNSHLWWFRLIFAKRRP